MSNSPLDTSDAIAGITKNKLGLFSKGPTSEFSIPTPFKSRICLIEDIHVAGTAHVKGVEIAVEQLAKDQELRFERDKGNLQDHWAIRVFADNDKLGFVPCDSNEILARMMDGGKKVLGIFTQAEKLGRWNKVHMGVYLDD